GALLVEAMRPVAQCLPVHGSDLGGVLTAHAVEHSPQWQPPPPRVCILCPLRQLPQFARTKIRAQWHRPTHRPARESVLSQGMESQGPRQRNPQPRVTFNEGWYYSI